MKIANYFVLIGTGLVMFPLQSLAVDLPMRQTPPPTPVAEGCFSSFSAWIQTSAAECPLSYAGVTLYGTVDAGYGYETNGAKFNAQYPNGVNELVSAVNHGAKWQGTPNALSQSNIGIKWSEPVFSQWNFIGDVRAAFDPYSLRFANGPGALEDNNLTPAFSRSAALDSSLAYGPVNALAYAGLQNPVWGMLTYGRQLTFSGENSLTYDPFGGGYAFSMQGTSGALGGGLGDTEMVRYGHSLKYVYTDDGVRVGVISQLGGWELGNNAKYAAQGDIGFDYQGFSVDGVYSYARDAVSLSIWDDGLFPNTLTAKIENISAFELATKYVWQDFTLFGAYQYDHITNPSVLPRGVNFAHFNDDVTARYGTGVQGELFLSRGICKTFGWGANGLFCLRSISRWAIIWLGRMIILAARRHIRVRRPVVLTISTLRGRIALNVRDRKMRSRAWWIGMLQSVLIFMWGRCIPMPTKV